MSTIRDLATWIGHAFLFAAVLAALVMSWGGSGIALLAFVALLVKAVGAALPWSWGAIVFALVGSLLVSWVGRIIGRAIGDDGNPVPPTADLSESGWRERSTPRPVSRPASRPSPSPHPHLRAAAPSRPQSFYVPPASSSSTADDILTAVVIHDLATHHHDDCGSHDGGYEASCGGCGGD